MKIFRSHGDSVSYIGRGAEAVFHREFPHLAALPRGIERHSQSAGSREVVFLRQAHQFRRPAIPFDTKVDSAIDLFVRQIDVDGLKVCGPGILQRIVRVQAHFRHVSGRKSNLARLLQNFIARGQRYGAGAHTEQWKQRKRSGEKRAGRYSFQSSTNFTGPSSFGKVKTEGTRVASRDQEPLKCRRISASFMPCRRSATILLVSESGMPRRASSSSVVLLKPAFFMPASDAPESTGSPFARCRATSRRISSGIPASRIA